MSALVPAFKGGCAEPSKTTRSAAKACATPMVNANIVIRPAKVWGDSKNKVL